MSYLPMIHSLRIGEYNNISMHRSLEYDRILNLTLSEKQLQFSRENGVLCMQLETYENRYLISSGAEKKICIYDTWNLSTNVNSHFHIPQVATVGGKERHIKFMHQKAINCVQWYPHDTGMFISSSFDGTIKIWDTNRLRPAETMDIKTPICNHDISPISKHHSLIAAASASHVRLADMRSGSNSHVLKGHENSVLYVKWSPKDEYILASGGEDCRVLLWDVRQARSKLFDFDQHNGDSTHASRSARKAHTGNVNSLQFNQDGRYLISYAADNRIRLWDTGLGHNTLINYGLVENISKHRSLHMSKYNGGPTSSVLFVPSGRQVIMYDIYGGKLIKKLSGHFSNVRCCEFNNSKQELYTAAQASNVLVWSPFVGNQMVQPAINRTLTRAGTSQNQSLITDTWSDDD